jgi:AbrB family looped-hinge helix DNA binding protein
MRFTFLIFPPNILSKKAFMIPTNLSSKGQITIPKQFRQRMKLTGRRRVTVEQLRDGTIMIRPVRSILNLAGTISLKRSLLPAQQERREAQEALAKEKGGNRN